MSAREHSFDRLAGVPTHYARQPVAAYGTIGKPRAFHCTDAFFIKLDRCFAELWRVCPQGQARAVVSAGAHVNKAGKHGEGRAFDLDAIHWSSKTFVTKEFNADRKFYLGVEAVLRKHFGTVLAYRYNRAHQDHFHIDDGASVGYRTVRTVTLFVQGVCQDLLGMTFDGGVDGKSGSATRGALDKACTELGVAKPLTSAANWLAFLDAVARRGMAGSTSSRLPADYDCTVH